MSKKIEFSTKKKFELLPDYTVGGDAYGVTFYIDSHIEKLADVMSAINEDGALDKVIVYKDGEIEGVYTGYTEFTALSSTGIAYALTLSRANDQTVVDSLSKQVSDLTKESTTNAATVKQNASDITDLQEAIADLYEQQTAKEDAKS